MRGTERSDEPEGLARAKAELRANMRRELRSIPPVERLRRGRAAADLLTALPELAGAGTVMAFLSFGTEIPTEPLIEALATSEPPRVLLLPYLEGGTMRATPYRPGDELSSTTYGPREPAGRRSIAPAEIEVVVVPGTAFDRAGRRLGRGGGFYDAFLAELPPDAVRIGFGYREQLVDRVPEGVADRRVDLVVTDREVVECHGSEPGTAR